MNKLSMDEIKKMEVKISTKEEMTTNYINLKASVKLSWAEINNIELMKLENLIDKVRMNYLKMEAEKQRISHLTASNNEDFIDPALIEKALYNSNIEAENQKMDHPTGEEDRKFEIEYHESFCS